MHLLAFVLGPLEIVIIVVIAFLLFGRRLPELAKGVGRSIVEFKKGLKEADTEINKPADEPANKTPMPPASPSQN